MNISNLGRLIGAGLLALGLHAFAPSATAQTFSGGLPAGPTPGCQVADWICQH